MNCPECQSEQILKNGKARLQDHRSLQKYVCKACGKQFNERTGTPMSRLRSTPECLSLALNVRTEGLGLRATGRVLGKSHATIIRWEQRLAAQVESWSRQPREARWPHERGARWPGRGSRGDGGAASRRNPGRVL
jgi:transposase-like protein